MPDAARQTIGVRGTFNAMEAAGLGGGGIADAMLEAQRQTAKNTEKIAQLCAALGVTFIINGAVKQGILLATGGACLALTFLCLVPYSHLRVVHMLRLYQDVAAHHTKKKPERR